jgi:RHS repeat-associated protein
MLSFEGAAFHVDPIDQGSASRMRTAGGATNSANYSCLANFPLVDHIPYANNRVLRMLRQNQFDNLNRQTNLVWSVGSTVIASFAYQYNSANQRTRVTLVDGSYWLYGYDFLGQLNSAKHYWKDGTPVAGQQFGNVFDDIGNRLTNSFGGDTAGQNLRPASYFANNLNQYTNRTVPGYINLLGSANSNATVTLWTNGHLAALTSRKGEYYRGEIPANNSAGPLWLAIANFAVLNNGTNADIITNLSGNYFLPQTPEQSGYDADGNMANDGRWTISWDGENRALSFTSLSGTPDASKKKVGCDYDWQSRRIQKIVSGWNGSSYVAQFTNRFVYDGWNLIGILDGTNGLMFSFAWGLDLSGTPQDAGGVGGLISMTDYTGAASKTYFYVFDGNGNVVALVNAADGSIAAQYEYGPFGELLRATGPMARVNPFLFSTKFYDWGTGLYYYGYRYCDPSVGRWLSRDPLEELGAPNAYAFVGNDPAGALDPLGLYQEGGHYYTTYIAAIIAGRPTAAAALAFYSQLPDEVLPFTAFEARPGPVSKALGNYATEGAVAPFFDDVQRLLHSLAGGLAAPRRECLRKMLSDASLQTWEKGFLIHAFGDSYAHSRVDDQRTISVIDFASDTPTREANPNFGQDVLYEAPFGHAGDLSRPDYVTLRPDLYGRYLSALVGAISSAPLGQSQQSQIQAVLTQVKAAATKFSGLSDDTRARQEIQFFRQLATSSDFGYPANGYAPEQFGALTPTEFARGPGAGLPFGVPSEAQVKSLLAKIRKACCRR